LCNFEILTTTLHVSLRLPRRAGLLTSNKIFHILQTSMNVTDIGTFTIVAKMA